MYRWHIAYYMKDGRHVAGMYEGPEKESLAVMRKLFDGRDKDFISHFGLDDEHMIGVRIGEVISFEITKWSTYEKEKENG